MKRASARCAPRARGSVLALLLVLLAAGMALSAAVATSAVLELAMSDRAVARLRAAEAAEAGVAAALRARGWSSASPWTATGDLPESGRWQVEVRLFAARVDPHGGPVEWRFEIESAGEHGAARVTLLQSFDVTGALPGEPRPAGWRRLEPSP